MGVMGSRCSSCLHGATAFWGERRALDSIIHYSAFTLGSSHLHVCMARALLLCCSSFGCPPLPPFPHSNNCLLAHLPNLTNRPFDLLSLAVHIHYMRTEDGRMAEYFGHSAWHRLACLGEVLVWGIRVRFGLVWCCFHVHIIMSRRRRRRRLSYRARYHICLPGQKQRSTPFPHPRYWHVRAP